MVWERILVRIGDQFGHLSKNVWDRTRPQGTISDLPGVLILMRVINKRFTGLCEHCVRISPRKKIACIRPQSKSNLSAHKRVYAAPESPVHIPGGIGGVMAYKQHCVELWSKGCHKPGFDGEGAEGALPPPPPHPKLTIGQDEEFYDSREKCLPKRKSTKMKNVNGRYLF